jgi:hypothetical protein
MRDKSISISPKIAYIVLLLPQIWRIKAMNTQRHSNFKKNKKR